jgi:peroxiredoxin
MRNGISLLIALAVSAAGCASGQAAVTAPVSAALPGAHVVTLDGTVTDLAAATHGRAALINLWATWCDGCVAELDALKRLDAQTTGQEGAVVIGVAVGETRQTVAAFARDRRLAYTQLVDEDFALADALGERRVPATLVVDRTGRIVYRGGAMDEGSLAAFREAQGAR